MGKVKKGKSDSIRVMIITLWKVVKINIIPEVHVIVTNLKISD